ncbi:MAG: DUF4412 domain-containing protein [Chitinophagaceae bacterium]|nr:DUF4412 domain-containing protein [Chitinophagaceae bacterium]
MKQIVTVVLLTLSATAFAQPKVMTQAVITTKTVVSAPEEDEAMPSSMQSSNGEEVRVMRFGGDGETKTTTWLKNDWVKTFSESESSRTTAIRDNAKKITTTIMEIMGRKMGFYATDEDQEQMRKQMDSMMQSRGNDAQRAALGEAPKIDITYLEETKKIAGYECKKAIITATRSNGRTDSTMVWFIPDMKFQGVTSTGGALGGFGGMTTQVGSNGFDQLNGFPMEYIRMMNRGRKMVVQVTKLVTDKEIADKEFDIPKDVDIKPMKEMQNGGRPGTFQMRVGGGPH